MDWLPALSEWPGPVFTRIVEALVAAGIAPGRLSYRGLGEVLPLVLGESPTALERNRRAEFHVYQEGK